MSRASGGLTKWFKQNWVDISTKKKMVLLQSAVDQNKKQMLNVNIQSAFL
jgi:hypothetical protein